MKWGLFLGVLIVRTNWVDKMDSFAFPGVQFLYFEDISAEFKFNDYLSSGGMF